MADQIEEVKTKTDIVTIIGEQVELHKAGTNYKGICPFHGEKTASFMVSPQLQIYKCFGCGEGGDVFTFLEKTEGMDFPEALKFLADKAGVKLKSFVPQDNSKETLYQANEMASKFYNYLLTSHPIGKKALEYVVKERKISESSIKTFNLGFAPDSPQLLFNYLSKKKKMKTQDLVTSGLIVNIRGNFLDRFRGRIIFPINDHRGNAIALAGRLMPPERKDIGKYINSPETPVYHKSRNLYGLNITREFIKKANAVIVVEGELDLISSFQAGIKNVVAIKGSAVTSDQARLISRWANVVILALDSDFAGGNAALRGIEILQEADLEVRVARLGEFKDPDEIAKANPEKYKEAIEKAVPIWDFIIDSTIGRYNSKTGIGKRKISRELAPILGKITDKIVQAHYLSKLSKILDVPIDAVNEEVEKFSGEKKEAPSEVVKVKEEGKSRRELLEERLLGLLFSMDQEILKKEELKSLFQTRLATRLYGELSKGDNAANLPSELKENLALNTYIEDKDEKEIKKEINLIYKELMLLDAKDKLNEAAKMISSLEREKSEKELLEAKENFSNLTQYLQGLEKEKFRGII